MPARNETVSEYDIVVAGGGVAGVCAAIQSARLGARVALLEREMVLGGNSSPLFRLHLVGCARYHPHSRETGIIEELEAEVAWQSSFVDVGHGDYLNDHWGEILRSKCTEAGVDLYLKTVVTGLEMDGSRIAVLTAYDMLAHCLVRFRVGSSVVDATGDGEVALAAGAEYRLGPEARSEYGEDFAPENPDPRQKMASALLFMMRDTGRPVKYIPPPGTPVYSSEDDVPVGIESWNPQEPICIMWQTMFGGHLDTLFDDRVIYEQLLKTVHSTVDLLKNRGDYGAENYELFWISPYVGKREGRRFLGDYVLSQKDLFQPPGFDDRVAYGGRPVDLHEIQPDMTHYKIVFYGKPPLYSIPLRSLYSKDVDNLYLAGRCMSGTRVALGSYRVMKTLATAGQAIGAAAYLGIGDGLSPRGIYNSRLAELQQLLLREDATILDIQNEDPQDLARRGSAIASTETPEGPARNILDGVNRRVADMPTHMWISQQGLPQWIEVRLEKPCEIGTVQLAFDTDLDKARGYRYTPYLTAFPTTAADYRLLLNTDDGWAEVADVKDNYQRLRRHTFAPVTTDRIRLEITRAQADGCEARLYEMRAYP